MGGFCREVVLYIQTFIVLTLIDIKENPFTFFSLILILLAIYVPYLPYIFGRIKIIIFFLLSEHLIWKKYIISSVRIFMNAEKLPIIEGIHRCYEMKMHYSGFAEIYTTSNCR